MKDNFDVGFINSKGLNVFINPVNDIQSLIINTRFLMVMFRLKEQINIYNLNDFTSLQ